MIFTVWQNVRARYLAEHDRAARLKALDAALAEGLADVEAGRPVPVGDHLIFFSVGEAASRIDVLRVLRGARDIEAILFPSD